MKPRPPIPYYQPPQHATPSPGSDPITEEDDQHEPRYQQGYQAQAPYQPLKYEDIGRPTQDSPLDYEQPAAQYPEQLPPMTII